MTLERSKKGSFKFVRSSSSVAGSSKSFSFKKRSTQEKNALIVCFGEMLIDFVPTTAGVSLADAEGFKKQLVELLLMLQLEYQD